MKKQAHKQKMLNSRSAVTRGEFTVGDYVLVYVPPSSKLGSTWKKGRVTAINEYGYVVDDGATHIPEHIKFDPDATELNPPEQFNVILLKTNSLVVVKQNDNDIFLAEVIKDSEPGHQVFVRKFLVKNDYTVKINENLLVNPTCVTLIPGRLETKLGVTYISRAASGMLRKAFPGLVPF